MATEAYVGNHSMLLVGDTSNYFDLSPVTGGVTNESTANVENINVFNDSGTKKAFLNTRNIINLDNGFEDNDIKAFDKLLAYQRNPSSRPIVVLLKGLGMPVPTATAVDARWYQSAISELSVSRVTDSMINLTGALAPKSRQWEACNASYGHGAYMRYTAAGTSTSLDIGTYDLTDQVIVICTEHTSGSKDFGLTVGSSDGTDVTITKEGIYILTPNANVTASASATVQVSADACEAEFIVIRGVSTI